MRKDWVDPERARLTIGKWGAQWLAGRVDLKPKTIAGYENLWSTQIKPTWEHVQLAGVTNGDVISGSRDAFPHVALGCARRTRLRRNSWPTR